MVVKKLLTITLSTLFLSASLLGGCSSTGNNSNSNSKKVTNIGISQLVEHPALDSSRKGFIDGLSSKGFKDGEKIKIEYQNAQGDIPTTQTIASNFVSSKKDLILAIATPAAQAAYNSTKDIPILITAVTDPVKSGLVKSMDKPDSNVTGTSDATPIDKQFELIKKLVPNVKSIGVLYNTSEANSEIQVGIAKAEASKMNIQLIATGVTSSNDIPQALDSILSKIDVLYIPTDNLIASSISLVNQKCLEKKIPVIGSEKGHVDSGALATEGIDYYKLGFQTGIIASEILSGKKPQDTAIQTLKETSLIINEATAKKLNLTIPDDLKSRAQLISGGAK